MCSPRLPSADTEVGAARSIHRRSQGATTPPDVIRCHLAFASNILTEVSLPVHEPRMRSADGTQLPSVASAPATFE